VIEVKLKDGTIGHVKEEDFEAFRKEYLQEENESAGLVASDLAAQISAAIKEAMPGEINKFEMTVTKRNSLGLIQKVAFEVKR
jgi:hypothetical protein